MSDAAPTIGSMTDDICAIALRRRPALWWTIAMIAAGSLTALLVGAIAWLFYAGIGIWGIDWPVVWGFAIISYVWWIAIASGGTFISALFYLVQVDWRTSLNRIAETMTLCAAVCAGIYPILHLGRPWLFYWLFPYPNTMGVWPQFRSPLLWDFFAILTYVTSSILFWYLGLVPDLATLRDRATTRKQQVLYGALALGFRGEDRQWRHYRAAYGILAAIMAPLVVSVHSIVGLDFAAAATPGWHSTEFPPFFVFGALLSGFAMVLLLVVPLRKLLHLEAFITERHLDVLCRLLLMSSLLVGYAYIMDVFSVFYSPERAERIVFMAKIHGPYAPIYWATILFNIALPQAMWFSRVRLNRAAIMLVCLAVIIGMWCERYTIVVMSVRRSALPSSWGDYHGTFWDWATLFGTVGLFLSGILLAVRFMPVISMFEMRGLLPGRRKRDSHT
jgi:Ni/Fe-hydrogenase subunit HybB-like protein